MESKAAYRERYLALLERYTPAVRRLCYSYCNSDSEADDLFQEIALALWTALSRFRGDSSERTWLYRIAHNVALTFAAKRRRLADKEQQEDGRVDVRSPDKDAESHLADQQRLAVLQSLVRELRIEDMRLVLLYLEGLSTAEIEAVTGLSRSNVTVRLTRIRQKLASLVESEGMQGR